MRLLDKLRRGVEFGRLKVVLEHDWLLSRPRLCREEGEPDMWVWFLGYLSVGWELR